MKKFTPFLALLASVVILPGKQAPRSCGSHADRPQEELRLHLQSDAGQVRNKLALGGKSAISLLPDIGDIAHLNAADGVVARRNPFNLNGRTVRFVPSDGTRKYRYEVTADSYEVAAALAGNLVSGLADDDSRELSIPFAFPFFGSEYHSLYINSDGNLSFNTGDPAITDRSLGRMLSGPPRIAALFRDLDPSRARNGIRILNEANRVVISWVEVPEYRDSGTGPLQTFQLRLYSDGKIEITYSDAKTLDAITGITPGNMRGDPDLVTFLDGNSRGDYTSSIAERFSGSDSVDIFAAAQKFFRNHQDAYDYLVIYNTLGVPADDFSVAYEVTVRNQRSGYGDRKTNVGEQAGSPSRLQAILNMGPLNQYPNDPTGLVPSRLSVGDTPLSTLAHESGHLFLAYASIRDEAGNKPMLGYQGAHWNFRFNSDASLLEGNRIQDNGAGVSPRFLTTATVQGFSALDQYLMGFRPAEEVPDMFYVANAKGANTTGLPHVGVAFDGERRDVSLRDLVDVEGRRTPDHTVSQRNFRFAFILVTADGESPTAEQLAQIESYRSQFAPYFQKVTGQNATAETVLRRAVQVSSFPAAGVVRGAAAPITVSIEQAATTPLTFTVRAKTGAVRAPQSVTIPAGALTAKFDLTGMSEGTDELLVEPADKTFESVNSRIQVSATSNLKLTVLTQASPVQLKVTDINELPYPGVTVQARTTGGGSLDKDSAVADAQGIVKFAWAQPSETASQLVAGIGSGPSVTIDAAVRPTFFAASVLNAASFAAGVVPGGIASIFGAHLGGTNARVLVNGQSTPVLFANDGQVNFVAPSDLQTGTAQIVVQAGSAASNAIPVPVLTVQPGLFFDAGSGVGAVMVAGTGRLTVDRPAARGDYLEVYATGLGSVRSGTVIRPEVAIAGLPAEIAYSGLAPGFAGLYQLNVRVPEAVPSGSQPLVITSAGVRSNEVKILVQ